MGTVSYRQQGITMSGFLITLAVLIALAVAGLKIIPAYIEDQTIKTKFIEVAHDPELQNSSPAEIRTAFRKRATVTDITAIKVDDIDVTKDGGAIVLSASYSVKIALFGNASLLLEFNPSSAAK
jgi:hypothetical protein